MLYELTALTKKGETETILMEGNSRAYILMSAKQYFARKYNSLDSTEDQFCMTWKEKKSEEKEELK